MDKGGLLYPELSKVANDFYLQHIKQVLGYLKATGLRLGIIVLFTKNGIRTKRVIN